MGINQTLVWLILCHLERWLAFYHSILLLFRFVEVLAFLIFGSSWKNDTMVLMWVTDSVARLTSS